jgi:hypothetical protein
MDFTFYIPCQTNPKTRFNALGVTVDHSKGKGIVLSAYPVERREGQPDLVGVTTGEYATLEPAKNKRPTRIAELTREAETEIMQQAGEAWSAVHKCLVANGLLLVDGQPQIVRPA